MTNSQIAETQSILLDLIRYFLAAVVVIGHGFGFFLGYFDGFFPRVFPHPQSIAVVCFFYLSGFLIVGSQLRQDSEGSSGLKKYLFDRTTRVYVTLMPSLLFVVMADMLFQKYTAVNSNLVTNYTSFEFLIKNALLIPSMPYGTMRPIWSLMYEWWIYLLFGGLFFLRKNFIAALLLIVVGFYYTVTVNGRGEAGHIWIIWALGGACAFLQRRVVGGTINPHILNAASIFFLTAAGFIYFLSKDAYDIFAGIAISLSIFVFTSHRSSFLKFVLPLRTIAKNLAELSFTLFLTHYTVLTYTKDYLKIEGWYGLIFGFIASGFVAFFIAFFTEYRLSSAKAFLLRRPKYNANSKASATINR